MNELSYTHREIIDFGKSGINIFLICFIMVQYNIRHRKEIIMEIENMKNLSTIIQKEINDGYIGGAAIKVFQNNELCYEDVLGYADIENGTLMKKDTIYRMYSMSKPITAVATMILYERGIINLFEPVSDYLEGFQNQKVLTENGLVDVNRPVTIQDLLNMTAGVVYPDESFEVGRRMGELFSEVENAYHRGIGINTIDFCNRMGQVPLEFQPGERWRYGACADVLGAVIEVATGRKLSEFLKEEIFLPLNMVDTGFYVPKEKHSRFSRIYDYKNDKKCLEHFTGDFLALFDFMSSPAFESAGAGLVSTMEDYSHFALMLANGGTYNGRRILGRKTIDYIATPQLTKEQSESFNWDFQVGYSYGNLMRVMVDPAKAYSNGSIGEFGWDGWCGNYFFVDPKEKLVMLYMVQRCGGSGPNYMRKLRSVVYSAL